MRYISISVKKIKKNKKHPNHPHSLQSLIRDAGAHSMDTFLQKCRLILSQSCRGKAGIYEWLIYILFSCMTFGQA